MALNHSLPPCTDTIIIGNGPSALILSYLLHGNFPYYNPTPPHPDPLLHAKLEKGPKLLDIDIGHLTEHFAASRLSYSTQSLPVNVLLDTLLRPLADTEYEEIRSCVQWQSHPEKAVPHVVLGDTSRPGGQWTGNPVAASLDIGTLSYAEMLSLPDYTFAEHHQRITGKPLAQFTRPTRREVAEYFATYPHHVGIAGSIYTSIEVKGISRTSDGFYISSHNIHCKHVVLASGIFSHLIAPRPLLQPLLALPSQTSLASPPLLVVGSGFTAADIILSTPPDQKIIHIFKWAPDVQPSPLRACHQHAYPEYAAVYRRMKLAALKCGGARTVTSPLTRRKSNPFFTQRDWESVYEGFPNTAIVAVSIDGSAGLVSLQLENGTITDRQVSGMRYAIGRRGSLQYLDEDLRADVLRNPDHQNGLESVDANSISAKTLRAKAEATTEVARNVFITGSLTGDSLVRFAFGGCVYAAGRIIARTGTNKVAAPVQSVPQRPASDALNEVPQGSTERFDRFFDAGPITNGHTQLHLDRRREAHSIDFQHATVQA
ncbi:MAG: hypothetical protein M1830_004580 [Pleopsidium flavum]|nr:MAG: hypothetical protein M1830_004580 [Pleopsidium flavum]